MKFQKNDFLVNFFLAQNQLLKHFTIQKNGRWKGHVVELSKADVHESAFPIKAGVKPEGPFRPFYLKSPGQGFNGPKGRFGHFI